MNVIYQVQRNGAQVLKCVQTKAHFRNRKTLYGEYAERPSKRNYYTRVSYEQRRQHRRSRQQLNNNKIHQKLKHVRTEWNHLMSFPCTLLCFLTLMGRSAAVRHLFSPILLQSSNVIRVKWMRKKNRKKFNRVKELKFDVFFPRQEEKTGSIVT